MQTLLGQRYGTCERERLRLEGELLGGPGIQAMLAQMGCFISKLSLFRLGDGLECSIGERITQKFQGAEEERGAVSG